MTDSDRERWTIRIERTGAPLAVRVAVARGWRARMIGLLGRRALPPGEALVLPRCRSIHTVGMRFPIDAIFVDRGWRVVALKPGLKPWRMAGPVWRAWGVIEMAAGSLARTELAAGDQLQLIEQPLEGERVDDAARLDKSARD